MESVACLIEDGDVEIPLFCIENRCNPLDIGVCVIHIIQSIVCQRIECIDRNDLGPHGKSRHLGEGDGDAYAGKTAGAFGEIDMLNVFSGQSVS